MNFNLSVLKANLYRDYFISKGIPLNKITAIGFGEERPASIEHNAEAYKLNNRIEVLFKEN